MPASFRLRHRHRRGAPLLEAVLLLPFLLLIIAGAIEYRRAFTVSAALTSAATRGAACNGDVSHIQATVRRQLHESLGVDESCVEVTAAVDSTARRRVQVIVPYRLVGSALAAFLPTANVTGSAVFSR